jgi:lysine decarboxylase
LPEPGSLTFCLGLDPPRALERRLVGHLLELRRVLGSDPLPPFAPPPLPLVAEPDVPVGEAWRSASLSLPLPEAVGRVAAEPVCPYPPGIPLLIPGERIDAERCAWLLGQRQRWPAQIADTVRVVAE